MAVLGSCLSCGAPQRFVAETSREPGTPGPTRSAFVEGTCRLVAASDQHSQTESAVLPASSDAGCLVWFFPVIVLAPAM